MPDYPASRLTMPAASNVKSGMQQRIAYGSTAVAMLVLLFLLDIEIARQSLRWEGLVGDLLSRGSILPVAFLVIVLRGAFELNRLMRSSGARPHARFAYWMIALLVLTPWFSAAGWLQGATRKLDHGRIAILGEAAMCTAQFDDLDGEIDAPLIPQGINALHAPQNAQFCLNVMHWLSGLLDE